NAAAEQRRPVRQRTRTVLAPTERQIRRATERAAGHVIKFRAVRAGVLAVVYLAARDQHLSSRQQRGGVVAAFLDGRAGVGGKPGDGVVERRDAPIHAQVFAVRQQRPSRGALETGRQTERFRHRV